MSSTDELKALAVSTHDFYALLSLPPDFTPSDLRRAWRQTAPKYHPDKVGDDPALRAKFDLAKAGYEIFQHPELRGLYDSTRNAREQQRLRDEALNGERRRMKEKLDAAERRGAQQQQQQGATERDVGGDDEESRLRQKLRRLKEDAERRKALLEAQRKRERQQRKAAASAPVSTAKENRKPGVARRSSDDEGSPFVGKDGAPSLAEQVLNRLRSQATETSAW